MHAAALIGGDMGDVWAWANGYGAGAVNDARKHPPRPWNCSAASPSSTGPARPPTPRADVLLITQQLPGNPGRHRRARGRLVVAAVRMRALSPIDRGTDRLENARF